MNNTLTLVRGLPGSGKSTYAKGLPSHIHLEADMFHMEKGVYKFNGTFVKAAHHWCQTSTEIFLNAGYNVIVSNTFTTLKEMEFYIDKAAFIDCQLNVIRMNKNYGNIHSVPEDVLKKMAARFEDYPGEYIMNYDDEGK